MHKLAPLVLLACGYVDPGTEPDAMSDPPDAVPVLDSPPVMPPALGSFGAPSLISELSTTSGDEDPSMTADGRELFFRSSRPGGPGGGDIWTTKRASSTTPWETPVLVSELSTAATELSPRISADGLRMYFSRAGDIFITARATRNAPWAPPTAVTELNTVAGESRASVTPDELLLVLDSDRGGNSGRDLYLSTRPSTTSVWSAPVAITELNTLATDGNGMLSDDGLTIYFQRNGLFVASRASHTESFGTAVRLDELGTADANDPWISADQRTLLFSSSRSGNLDIYIATR